MKLSVVIPVYQVESTLNRCVESVLSQDIDDMEVILVDDGSPDQCPKMCDEWAARNQHVCVIHKPNGGLSDARNAGIEQATGELITFIDSDDWLQPGTYRVLLKLMDSVDILEYSIADRLQLTDNLYRDVSQYWLETRAYTHTYAWNKIYRRSLFDHVRYPIGRLFEDVYTLPLLLREARTIATTSHGYYHYSQNPKGITATADGHALGQLLDAHLKGKMPIDDSYYMYLVNIQADVWERLGNDIVLPKRTTGLSSLTGFNKIKAIAINIFGVKTTCRIIKAIHLIKSPSHW